LRYEKCTTAVQGDGWIVGDGLSRNIGGLSGSFGSFGVFRGLWDLSGSAAIITELSDKRRCMRRHNRRLQFDGYVRTHICTGCACATDRHGCELMCHVGAVPLTLRDLYGERWQLAKISCQSALRAPGSKLLVSGMGNSWRHN